MLPPRFSQCRGIRSFRRPGASSTLDADICAFPGTTYSCVATYEGNNVEIIANEQGSFTTPSFVSFTAEERLIGEAAKNQAAMNPRNTVFDVKYVHRHSVGRSSAGERHTLLTLHPSQASHRSPLR